MERKIQYEGVTMTGLLIPQIRCGKPEGRRLFPEWGMASKQHRLPAWTERSLSMALWNRQRRGSGSKPSLNRRRTQAGSLCYIER